MEQDFTTLKSYRRCNHFFPSPRLQDREQYNYAIHLAKLPTGNMHVCTQLANEAISYSKSPYCNFLVL